MADHEVWLIDTGHFFVMDEVHSSWVDDPLWVSKMQSRCVLKMRLDDDQMVMLPMLEKSFGAAKAFFEMSQMLLKTKDVQSPERKLAEAFARLVPPENEGAIRLVPTIYGPSRK